MTALLLPVRQPARLSGRGATGSGRSPSPRVPWAAPRVTISVRTLAVAALAACAAFAALPCGAATATELLARGREIEAYLDGFPKRALPELEGLRGGLRL